jgi:hypothetical protein
MQTKCALPVEIQANPKAVAELQQPNKVNDCNLAFNSVALPAICEDPHSKIFASSSEKMISSNRTKCFEPSVMSIVSNSATSKKLKNPYKEKIEKARSEIFLKGLSLWKTGENFYSPEETELLTKISQLFSTAYHISMPEEDLLVLTSNDYTSVVSIIKKLARKVGLAELGTMILLAIAVDDNFYLKKAGYNGESDFFQQNASLMGISPSCSRDYAIRGRIFLRYRLDILNGIDDVTGISLETFANTCMAKLSLYEKAVDEFGNKQALIYLKTLSFREFKKIIPTKGTEGYSFKRKKRLKESSLSVLDYNLRLQELELRQSEKRLLRILAKRGIPVPIGQYLTDHQIFLIETRYREARVKSMQEYYDSTSKKWVYYKEMDPDFPLRVDDLCFHNGTAWEKIIGSREDYKESGCYFPGDSRPFFDSTSRIFNFEDIILRIRFGLKQIQPARRTIAVLLFKLVNEKGLKGKWKKPREGVEYKSFKDFAIEELGLRENYRDYLAVGKVLKCTSQDEI